MTASDARPATRLLLVTGLSGAGKSVTLKVLEDLGYEAIDNLPLRLVHNLVRDAEDAAPAMALGLDIRTRDFDADTFIAVVDGLRRREHLDVHLLFLDGEEEILRRRFSETRRRHPLAADRPVLDGIRHERLLMRPVRAAADTRIDTSRLSVVELRQVLEGSYALDGPRRLSVFVTSFGFRRGLPRDADLVIDVRFLSNPYYDTALKPLTGLDGDVVSHVEADPDFATFFKGLCDMLLPLLPRYLAEGKSYLTIAIGCTGGRHRSVVVAEKLTRWLSENGIAAQVRHHDID